MQQHVYGQLFCLLSIYFFEYCRNRRDLTINSLFYNIQTDCVEDFTGQGLADIENKLVRTPLEPLVTFLDDPLRVLRAIRFTARFNFKVAPELLLSVLDPAVFESFNNKVSRQRILAEIEGTLGGSDIQSIHGLCLLHQSNLMRVVIVSPPRLPDETVTEYTTPNNSDISKDILMFFNLDQCAAVSILAGFVKLLVSNDSAYYNKFTETDFVTANFFHFSVDPSMALISR